MDHERFAKEQRQSVRKALSKEAVPLKLKHAQIIIQGTHQDQSSSIFWGATSDIDLEKHPLTTWKFCHLMHGLIRDGHESVIVDSQRHLRRISRTGDFWLNLHASGYGAVNERYCSMICERLEFHRKYPQIPGNLIISGSVVRDLKHEPSIAFEATVDVLDQMKSLLLLPRRVFTFLDYVQWPHNSQVQTIMAPLILVILDTVQLYALLSDLMQYLHIIYSPATLWMLRKRFQETHIQLFDFYSQARRISYITHHVKVPDLPRFASVNLESAHYIPSIFVDAAESLISNPDRDSLPNFVDVSNSYETTPLVILPETIIEGTGERIPCNTLNSGLTSDPPPYELLLPD